MTTVNLYVMEKQTVVIGQRRERLSQGALFKCPITL